MFRDPDERAVERVDERAGERAGLPGMPPGGPDWLPYSFSIVGAEKEWHLHAVDRARPAPPGGPGTAQGAPVLHPRGHGLDPPRLLRLPPGARRSAWYAGDATPAYLFWPEALTRMHAYNPETRLIAVFRDPLERLFSHWTREVLRHMDHLAGLAAVHHRVPAPDHADVPAGRAVAGVQAALRGSTSYYGNHLTRGLTVFPREQWLWLEFRGNTGRLPPRAGPADRLPRRGPLRTPPRGRPADERARAGRQRHQTAADLASLAQLYAADLAQFRAVSRLRSIDAWPTVLILSGRLSPTELAERFASRVEPLPATATPEGHVEAG